MRCWEQHDKLSGRAQQATCQKFFYKWGGAEKRLQYQAQCSYSVGNLQEDEVAEIG